MDELILTMMVMASEDILEEAKQLVAAGYKDITLLGQNFNSYGQDLLLKGARLKNTDWIIDYCCWRFLPKVILARIKNFLFLYHLSMLR